MSVSVNFTNTVGSEILTDLFLKNTDLLNNKGYINIVIEQIASIDYICNDV